MVLRPDRGRRHEVPNLGSPTRRPRQRSMCGVMGSPSHTVFDPHRGRINGKCHTRPRGVDPYGVLTPGYQDLTALRSLAPIGAVVLTLFPGLRDLYSSTFCAGNDP